MVESGDVREEILMFIEKVMEQSNCVVVPFGLTHGADDIVAHHDLCIPSMITLFTYSEARDLRCLVQFRELDQ